MNQQKVVEQLESGVQQNVTPACVSLAPREDYTPPLPLRQNPKLVT